MNTIKALLLPLAMIFGAIAVFETGARYGGTNVRALAIANELQMTLNMAIQNHAVMNEESKRNFAIIIDNGIAAGAMHRNLWYLNKEAKAALDNVLTYALSVRGAGTEQHFEFLANLEDVPAAQKAKLSEIRTAVRDAQIELIDNAPKAEEEAPAETTETVAE